MNRAKQRIGLSAIQPSSVMCADPTVEHIAAVSAPRGSEQLIEMCTVGVAAASPRGHQHGRYRRIDDTCDAVLSTAITLASPVLSMPGRHPQGSAAGVTKGPGSVALADFAGQQDLRFPVRHA